MGVLLLLGATGAQATTVLCESTNDAYKSCAINGSGGVRLSRQLSTQGCWLNDTWGYDRNKIWVNRGCRAEFEVGAQKTGASGNGSAVAAAAVVGIAAAAIIANNHGDDHHKNNNDRNYDRYNDGYYDRTYDRSYDQRHDKGYDDRYDGNGRYGYNGYGGDPRSTFSCESKGDRRNYCDIPRRGHVEVYRQRSLSACTYGYSWGVERNSVWVAKGCRAEFAVY